MLFHTQKKTTILLRKLTIQVTYLTCCRYLKTLKLDKYSTVFTISVLYKNVNYKILVTLEVTFSNDYNVEITKSRRNNAFYRKAAFPVAETGLGNQV